MTTSADRPPAVVVGVDGTRTGLRATAWAAIEARDRGVRLRIVHGAPYGVTAEGRHRAGAIVARAHGVAEQVAPGVAVETEVRTDPPVTALVGAAGPGDLLVVGTTPTQLGEVRLGSVASAVTAAAVGEHHRPVVVVRASGAAPGPVVIGLDLSHPLDEPDGDGDTIDYGLAAAERVGAAVRVVHAGHPDNGGRLRAALQPWLGRHPAVEVTVETVSGAPDVALMEASAGARLLVVGGRTHGRVLGALLGSVSRALIHDAHCPVAVVPRRSPGLGGGGTVTLIGAAR